MLPLTPAPAVRLDGVDLIAYDALRTFDGLTATVGAVNGEAEHLRVVAFADPADRAAYAVEVLKLLPGAGGDIGAGLIKLHNLTEGALRQAEARQAAPKAEAPWPEPLAEEAYHGLAGDLVRVVAPHSEAAPVAILAQTLVAFGSVVGRSPHYIVEADRHGMNEFICLVGETAKGRKGTSQGVVARVFALLEDYLAGDELAGRWIQARQASGLSSGEGVIWAVRDAIVSHQPVKDHGRVVEYQDVETDPGVADKRLMVVESELAQALKVLAREGNTLSPVLRNAWDSGTLRILTKNSPAHATEAHISIIGHITKDELRRDMAAVEGLNGFANRFLWLCVRRSQCLPEGGGLTDELLAPLAQRLAGAVTFAQNVERMSRDDDARALWAAVYPALSEGKPGLFGAVTARAEAHVLRLSCIYALLERSNTVQPAHLLAALALWEYAEASARYIFGDATGDTLTDTLLDALRAAGDAGLTRDAIYRDVFGKHRRAEEIEQAVQALQQRGLARMKREETAGRTRERWIAATL